MKRHIPSLIVMLLCAVMLVSCDKDDEPSKSEIIGTWYGTRSYYNPAGGTKYQYLTIKFEANGTGSLEYEAPTSYSVAQFTYSVKKDIITCVGAYANSYGDIESDFEISLRIEGDRLIPLNRYTLFILTKDNSVMTDSNGNEVNNNNNDNNNNNNNDNSDPIEELVKANISASVSYGDYGWNMTINSKLASKFPGKSLTYGTDCGYGSYFYYDNFVFDGRADCQKTDGQGNMYIQFPVFVGNEYSNEMMYFYSYKFLKSKIESGEKLSDEERSLYDQLINYMKKEESSARASYCGRLYVVIDNKKYYYHYYGNKPSK